MSINRVKPTKTQAEHMPKSTKRFVISDSRLNSHGFRMLTSGADLTDFLANPIMYWMHIYPTGEKKDELLPIGFWEDVKVEGDKITAVPVFDDNDSFAMTIYNKVEHGTIRACSAGAEPKPGGLSVDPSVMLEGQELPTFTKWWLREASICDRGSNTGAVAVKLKGSMVTLSDKSADFLKEQLNEFLNNPKEQMKITTLTAPAISAMLSALKLNADTATETDVTEAVSKLVQLSSSQAAQINTLTSEKKEADEKVVKLQADLATQVKLANEAKIETLVQGAVDARKITADQKAKYVKLAEKDFETTKEVLDGLVGSATVKDTLSGASENGKTELAELVKLSYDELFNGGKLVKLKALDPESYKAKYKEKFGKEPAN